MAKTVELCRPCAEALRFAGFTVTQKAGGVDHKITCGVCSRRRFGAEYLVVKSRRKKEVKADAKDDPAL